MVPFFVAKKKEIEKAVQAVRRGRTYFSQRVSGTLQREVIRSKQFRRNFRRRQQISQREMEVLVRICREETNREIAEALSLSVRTVDNHRRRLLEKCEAKNTAGLVMYAMQRLGGRSRFVNEKGLSANMTTFPLNNLTLLCSLCLVPAVRWFGRRPP